METTTTAHGLSDEALARARNVHRLATAGATTGERIAAWARLMDMSVAAHIPLPDFLAACGLSLSEGAKQEEVPPALTTAADFRRLQPAVGAQKGMVHLALHDAETLAATIVVAAVHSPGIVPALLDAAAAVAGTGEVGGALRHRAAYACGVRTGDDEDAAGSARFIREWAEWARG